jgi:hypothetical protein
MEAGKSTGLNACRWMLGRRGSTHPAVQLVDDPGPALSQAPPGMECLGAEVLLSLW